MTTEPKIAERLLRRYGEVLERMSSMTFGIPESALPDKKAKIKEAFKVQLAFLETSYQERLNSLELGYMHLADFVPDEVARIGANAQKGLRSLQPVEPARDKQERLRELSEAAKRLNSTDLSLGVQILRTTSEEMRALIAEFRSLEAAVRELTEIKVFGAKRTTPIVEKD